MKKPDSVYHLSHTDLDGYACQFLTSHCFKKIRFQNSNYGDEITGRLKIFFDAMLLDPGKTILLLITDLNLSMQQCEFIEKQIERLHNLKSGVTLQVQLLDHHGSGKEPAEKYPWYFLDTTRSATKITYDWLVETVGCQAVTRYKNLVDAINAIDIWLTEEKGFEFGKVLMGAIASSREVGRALFDEQDREHKFHMIRSAHDLIEEENAHIRLDNEMHAIKKAFFAKNRDDNTLDNLVADYLTDLLTARKEDLKIRYKDKTGVLTFGIPNISVIGNAFLVANPDIDFILNISPNGSISLRSNNKADVSEIAATLAGGGGHPNASGGRIHNFKETYSYADAKKFIETLIEEKTKES
ncbi:DHH family phosphoesterase [Hydrogenimonas urashimensis]|uniref:DHH family phosphoesterase n=1 Tax=Hydrogenimonas urashimensis TaxID=2740515 RepID=UPI00191618DB|nr:phosphoesterase [Hydrogenimonas urashimensis]